MSTTVWGNAVGPWRVGLRYDVVQLVGGGATIIAAVVVQSSNAISETYSEAWLACDGQSSGGGGHAISAAAGQTVEVLSHTFSVAPTQSRRTVRVAASLLMPVGAEVPGSSFVETTVTVGGEETDVPPSPMMSLSVGGTSAAWSATVNQSISGRWASSLKVQTSQDGTSWQTAATVQLARTDTAASGSLTLAANSRVYVRGVCSNGEGDSLPSVAAAVKTTPASVASLAGSYDGSRATMTWASRSPFADGFRLTRLSGSTWVTVATTTGSTASEASPPVGTVTYGVESYVQNGSPAVRTYGARETVVVATTTTADYPQVSLSPVTVHGLPWTLAWTAEPGAQHYAITSQRVRIVVDGSTVLDSSVPVGTTSLSVDALAGSGTAMVSVTDSHGLTTTKSAAVTKDFWPPAEPSATVSTVGNALRFTPTVGSGSSKAATESFMLVRGGVVVAACLPGGTLTDALAPINVATAYAVVARAANGLSAEHAVTATLALDHGAVDAMGRSFDVVLDPEVSESAQRGGESLQLAGDELPTWFGDGTLSASVRLGFTVLADGFADLRNVARFADVAEVRSPDGRCWHGHPSWTFERDMEGAEKVRVTLTEVMDGA